jgi:hypothetical protein
LLVVAVGVAPRVALNAMQCACAAAVLTAIKCVFALNAADSACDALVVMVWSVMPGSEGA